MFRSVTIIRELVLEPSLKLQLLKTFGKSTSLCTMQWCGSILCQVHTYLLSPWSRVLLEKLTGSAASQEIPRLFGTRRFLTVPTSARHLSLTRANSIQSPQLPPTSWRSILILSSHLRLDLPNGLFPSGFPTRCQVHSDVYVVCSAERTYRQTDRDAV